MFRGVFFLDFSEIDLKDEKDSTLEQSGSASFDGSVFCFCALLVKVADGALLDEKTKFIVSNQLQKHSSN